MDLEKLVNLCQILDKKDYELLVYVRDTSPSENEMKAFFGNEIYSRAITLRQVKLFEISDPYEFDSENLPHEITADGERAIEYIERTRSLLPLKFQREDKARNDN